jgi:hypothetical protein
MSKIFNWLICEDIKREKKDRLEEVENYRKSIDSQPSTTNRGLVILTKNIIELNYSATKYSRALIILTVGLVILTLVMMFK